MWSGWGGTGGFRVEAFRWLKEKPKILYLTTVFVVAVEEMMDELK